MSDFEKDGMEFVSIPLSKQDVETVEQIATDKDMSVETFLRRTVRKALAQHGQKKELDLE